VTITLRPVTEADRDFLTTLYASTREEELRAVPWSAEQRAAFLRQQFDAQDLHYREHYPGATLDVICDDGAPIGRFYVYRTQSEVRLMDIILAPEHCGRGIGSRLLEGLFAEAARAGQKVTLHVVPWSRSRGLYERLGFRVVEQRGAYLFMERPAPELTA
jgi:GNAT superfamily N-acetyltransferase